MLNKRKDKGSSCNKHDYIHNPWSRLFQFNRTFRLIHNYKRQSSRERRRRRRRQRKEKDHKSIELIEFYIKYTIVIAISID